MYSNPHRGTKGGLLGNRRFCAAHPSAAHVRLIRTTFETASYFGAWVKSVIASASAISLFLPPPASCVERLISPLLYEFHQSGWWSAFSASKATCVMNDHASTKVL